MSQCDLCQKAFETAEFVAKHIVNKHALQIAQAQDESRMFNFYVEDRRRPLFFPPMPFAAFH